jgi:predicted kinase
MSRLVLFCGIPGSGKTTIATALASQLPPSVLIQTDKVRAMIAKPTYAYAESKFVYGALIAIALEALRSGYDVLIEGTFPREEYRGEALAALSPMAEKSLVVYVTCEPELAFGRNARRQEVVPWESFLRIFTQFEEPHGVLRVDTGSISPEGAVQRIIAALEN